MKHTLAALTAAVLLLLALVPAAVADGRTITMNGSATVLTDADSAVITLGVTSAAKDAGEASRLNAAQIDRLITALTGAGIARADITTSYYYVNARYDFNAPAETGAYPVIGYEVTNSLSVTVRDISQVGPTIDLALSEGANTCEGIAFSTTQAAKAGDDALTAAIGEARRRAALAAEACGGKLGEILSVSETAFDNMLYVNNKRTVTAAEDGAATQITPSGLSFTASVMVTFALED